MLGVGGAEDLGAPGPHHLGAAVVDVGGGVEPNAGVAVLLVVPAEEPATEGMGVLEAAEPVGELGPVFHGAELALGVGVVVGAMRPGVRLGDPEAGQQERDGLGG